MAFRITYFPKTEISYKERYEHPTQKPEATVSWLIEYLSNPGDIVLDCFTGTGTFCKVAKELGRRYIGIDSSLKYLTIAKERLRPEVLFYIQERRKENAHSTSS